MSGIRLDVQLTHPLRGANGPLSLDVTFSVKAGESLALTGPSGAGKTSLLRQIAGFMTPEQGRVVANDMVWYDGTQKQVVPVQQRHIGYVFQDYALFPHFTVMQNLKFAVRNPKDQTRIEELLEITGLTSLADQKPHRLSGGQQQRVALARALVSKPPLLLLDEPMAALDAAMRSNIREFIARLRQRYGFTMIIITHDYADIFELADNVAVMKEGKFDQFGTPREVFMPNLPDTGTAYVHAEVIATEEIAGQFSAIVKIQNRIQSLKVAEGLYKTLKPGMHIALQVGQQPDDIRIILQS